LPEPILVINVDQLQECIHQLKECDAIALDTEFMRTDTFFPILGLVQIYNGETCWLIDPLAISDLSLLAEILIAPGIIKVFHSCSEDLEVLKHVLGCVPTPLFDTQVAAAFSGYGFSKGYAGLVEAMLGIPVAKGETRSDWLQRPLSESQLGYAALDVIHLLPVYRRLCDNLTHLGRSEWVNQEMTGVVEKASGNENLAEYFLKVKGAWQLDPQGLEALRLLCEWREIEARERNRPRGRVIGDKTLLDMVIKTPKNNHDLSDIEGMHPGLVRRYSEILLTLLQNGLATPLSDCPKTLPEPLPRQAGETTKQLKRIVNTQAELLDLPPEVLARKRDIEFLVRQLVEQRRACLPDTIAVGWRFDVIGQLLLEAANKLIR
jgi:ribonuclease D